MDDMSMLRQDLVLRAPRIDDRHLAALALGKGIPDTTRRTSITTRSNCGLNLSLNA
jgi:hypothetical protein